MRGYFTLKEPYGGEPILPTKATGAMLIVASCLLLVESPLLLLLGGWGGADSGSILGGVVVVLGLPWLIFLMFAGSAVYLANRSHRIAALAVAAVPAILELWIAVNLWPSQSL